MKVILFKPRFAKLVEAGTKRQTVRPTRKVPVKGGDVLSLREWTGLPYRSKQRTLATVTCTGTAQVNIGKDYLLIDELSINLEDSDLFAKRDGFESFEDLWRWFLKEHGSPYFNGTVIYW